MTDKQKIPLAQFDTTMSREEMARNLLMALQKAGLNTPPLEKVLEASSKKIESGNPYIAKRKRPELGGAKRLLIPKSHGDGSAGP